MNLPRPAQRSAIDRPSGSGKTWSNEEAGARRQQKYGQSLYRANPSHIGDGANRLIRSNTGVFPIGPQNGQRGPLRSRNRKGLQAVGSEAKPRNAPAYH